MVAEEFVHTVMVIVFVFCSVIIGACLVIFLLYLYWGNLTMSMFFATISVAGGSMIFMVLTEILLGFLHALYGIRDNLKKIDDNVHHDIMHLADLYVEDIVASRKEREIDRRRKRHE